MRDFLDHEFVPDVLIFNFFLLKEKFIVTSHGDIVATKEITQNKRPIQTASNE